MTNPDRNFKLWLFAIIVAIIFLMIQALMSVAHAKPLCMTTEALNKKADEVKMRPVFSGNAVMLETRTVDFRVIYIGPGGIWSVVTFSPDGEQACVLWDGANGKLLGVPL